MRIRHNPPQGTMTITVMSREYATLGSFVRSFDNERASGNFAVCRVQVGGKRFNRISCEHELNVYPKHPATATDGSGVTFYAACVAELTRIETQAYRAYVKACKTENLNAHDMQQWINHGRMKGPI